MLKIGLTGGIGSGKSTVSDIFSQLGVPVIDMDVIARQVVEPGSPALTEITETFGTSILNQDGCLDRQLLRQRIFESDSDRRKLETILHPLIRAETERQLAELQAAYCIIVIPLLAESGLQTFVDRVLVIDTAESLQLKRLMARDRVSDSEAQKILDAQAPRESRLQIANDVICNDGDLASLQKEVRQLHGQYSRLAENSA
ncbi:MAG: dephospho-CoA kinase [Proteobacteria bacterium]|jgi:dephospho-CoA kinase|nr:dephospho-CoA kinase [Pseudomonadota bacterium]